ncbi:hypothetical protein [Actinacidiphila acidipaludis]|uniref:Secreted protein n=1 Tax=Actinacidiphila acidipaludis TaxID=2873382 RepID=A0ABS7QDE9_9ACTN|nr:hypothetical protein [Streptomyces acidipaludis]MBY8881198.1 hypothetical protein [Streptomyces acidipaludis]
MFTLRKAARTGVLAVTALAAALTVSSAFAVGWNDTAAYVDSGKSTAGLQQLVWSPQPSGNLAAIDAAYAGGQLTADGSPGLAQVFSHTNKRMYYKTDAECDSARSAVTAADAAYTLAGWCFDHTSDEASSNAWVPQSVTTSQDAERSSGYHAGGDEVVVLWRHEADADNRTRCPGVPDDSGRSVGLRASFIDRPYTDGTHGGLRHVLLVAPGAPNASGLTFSPVCDVHGGGVVWFGPYLFVAQHGSGVLVFDTRRTYLVPDDTTCGRDGAAPGVNDVGQVTNSSGTQQLCAGGYRYVMFETGRFVTTPTGCSTTPATLYAGLCFSSLSLQWSDNALVSAEYRDPADMTASGAGARIVSWSTADLLDRMNTGATTPVTATGLAETNFEGVQGVVSRPNPTSGRPEFFIDRTVPGNDSSQLWYEQDNDGVCPAEGTFIDNAESMSYWVDSSGDAHLWSISEYGNRRMLVRVYTKEYNDPPSGCPEQ